MNELTEDTSVAILTMVAEDSKEIEAQVMAEIRSALNLSTMESPTSMVSMQKVSVSPQESTTAATEDDESCEFYETETFVKVNDGRLMKRNSTISLDGSSLHDSFLENLNVSYTSSIGGSSTGTNESSYHKFFIGTVSEETEECSVQSHVSDLGTEDLSHGELMDAVQRLYKQLKQAEDALTVERNKRRSREKNLLKLAKELGKRKNSSNKLLDKIAEMHDTISVLQSEKSSLEKRLKSQNQVIHEVKTAWQREADLQIERIVQRYQVTIGEQDDRVREINRMHAKQCEELCREVVDANQEIIRLQKVLSDMTLGAYPVDRTFVSTISRTETPSRLPSYTKPMRSRRVKNFVTLMAAFAIICVAYNVHISHDNKHTVNHVSLLSDDQTLVIDNVSPTYLSIFEPEDKLSMQCTDMDNNFQTAIDAYDYFDIKEVTKSLDKVLSTTDLRGVFFDSSLPLKWLKARIAELRTKESHFHE